MLETGDISSAQQKKFRVLVYGMKGDTEHLEHLEHRVLGGVRLVDDTQLVDISPEFWIHRDAPVSEGVVQMRRFPLWPTVCQALQYCTFVPPAQSWKQRDNFMIPRMLSAYDERKPHKDGSLHEPSLKMINI